MNMEMKHTLKDYHEKQNQVNFDEYQPSTHPCFRMLYVEKNFS